MGMATISAAGVVIRGQTTFTGESPNRASQHYHHLPLKKGQEGPCMYMESPRGCPPPSRPRPERLEILVNKEPPQRRQNAKLRVDQLKYDCKHLQAAMRNLKHRRYIESMKRPLTCCISVLRLLQEPDTSIMIDAALQHSTSLHNAHRSIDDLLGSGTAIIRGLRDQRAMLKGVHKRMLDVASSLGLSNVVMRMTEKRAFYDKFILYGGMIITCIAMFLIYKYLA
ncbi:Golgi SNAP receptor complex member 2-like [Ptychodera flava]|uniref:Golgi SNAP receptor complex member 2-like n=1 Tax=Ptychodera flava TaxID=63121 RepID=UPI00396A206C